MAFCEYAVPADRDHVQPNASKDTTNPRFSQEAFLPRGAACALKQFNDGKELPIERLPNHERDYTCVGPQDPNCPAVMGFTLVDVQAQDVAYSETAFHQYTYRMTIARKKK